MYKKLLLLTALLAASPVISQAKGTPYLGFGAGIQNTEGYNGLMASVSGGYSIIAGENQNYYLAGEIFADTGSLPLGQKYYHRTNYGFGASIIPGLYLRETVLVYVRVGIETFRFSTSLARTTGAQVGLGLQTSINKAWDIRGEYVYSGEGITNGFTTAQFNFFKVGLVFKFN